MARVVRIQSRICVGGPALHTILLTEGLSRSAGSPYETTLIGGALEPGEAPMHAFADERGVSFETIPEMGRSVNPVRDLIALAKVVALLRRERPVIVHTHTAKAGAIGRMAARLAGTPVVVHTFHGHVFDGYFSGPKAKAFVQVERALALASDCIIAISDQQRDDLVERYAIAPAEKVRVIGLGLDLDRFRAIEPALPPRGDSTKSEDLRSSPEGLRQNLGIDRDDPVIVAVGRIVPIKRLDLLVSAFIEVVKQPALASLGRLAQAHLLIVGDGAPSDRSALESMAAPVRDRVHFLGWQRDLASIYAAADLFVLTSDNEGTPVALIEALASGLPAVATRVGGVEDVMSSVMGSGLVSVVDRGDVHAIARAIERHAAAPIARHAVASRRLGDPYRDAIVRRYSHRRLIGDISSLYDTLLDAKRRTNPGQVEAYGC